MPSRWADVETDFDTAAQRLVSAHTSDGEHRDLPVDLQTWAVVPQEGRFALVPLARHHEPKVLRSSGFAGLAARVGAPVDFIRKLPAPLQLAAMNFLLSQQSDGGAVTLRLRNNDVAAIVSDRYAPFDPVELVETIRAALDRFGILRDVRVRGVASGLVDNLRLVLPAEQKAVKPGDVSMISLDIEASSFARASIKIAPGVFRLVCENGLIAHQRGGSGFSFRHVGDRHRIREAVSEAIPSALVRARSVLGNWEKAIAVMIDDVQRQVDALRELTAPEKKNVEQALLLETGSPTLPAIVPLYDLLNAQTAAAKLASPGRRLELEALAGAFLERHVGSA